MLGEKLANRLTAEKVDTISKTFMIWWAEMLIGRHIYLMSSMSGGRKLSLLTHLYPTKQIKSNHGVIFCLKKKG